MGTLLLEISIIAFYVISAVAAYFLGHRVSGKAGCLLNIAFGLMGVWNIGLLIGVPEAHPALRLLAMIITAWGLVWQGSYWIGNYVETHPKARAIIWAWLVIVIAAIYVGLQFLKDLQM